MRRFTAVITARAGSKGLPGKNTALLAGKPLVVHTLEAARNCPWVSHTAVTTDDAQVAQLARGVGAAVIDRPAELATDMASSVDAVEHALQCIGRAGKLEANFVLLQPTSPLRTAAHLTECLQEFARSDAACTVSVTEANHHPLKTLVQRGGSWEPACGDWGVLHQPRQVLGRACRPNGAIYAMAVSEFRVRRCFVFAPLLPYFMDERASVDIDTQADLERAARMVGSANP